MSATTLPLVAAMLLMAAIEIAVACCVWLRVDDECCGCWLFDGCCDGLPGLRLRVVCWPREGLCLMLVAAGMVGLLFTLQLAEGICRFWSFLLLGRGRACSRHVSAVDERDDVAACCGDAADGCD